ncbi:hypothetical protein [Runella slithyformis]|uniref:Uncharacterized protein n=1 Tax=Runella slithyformis (strain ATCC 29530 / DSM 19594 / LMG 11500 / NCIMB 11436 / LSU 4) TaxID=761193 RepID=A0A7U4E4G3_RUNSL|nr:hypothetical protein [Runella slithyformis]AEI47388.1 hypothetical protein Runsl_0954 [Runella slithyformis DSM 19594]
MKNDKEEFVWVPVKYKKSNEFPTLVSWKDGEEHIPKLAEFLKWNIAEGFIVYRDKKGVRNGFLVQVAYDPFRHKIGKAIEQSHYTGMIIHSDLNENPLRAWRFLDGKLDSSFDSDVNKGARTAQCYTTYYSYQTVSVESCGSNCTSVSVTLHQNVYTYCDDGNSGNGSGVQGYPYYPSGGGGNSTVTNTPPYNFYSPYVQYDFNKVARHEGEDYQNFMQRLSTALNVLNVSGISLGLPATYVDVTLKALGIQDAIVMGTATVSKVSSRIGWAGVSIGFTQLVIGWSDGEITDGDKLNALGLGLGILSVATPIGWVALSAGILSAGISIYTTANP